MIFSLAEAKRWYFATFPVPRCNLTIAQELLIVYLIMHLRVPPNFLYSRMDQCFFLSFYMMTQFLDLNVEHGSHTKPMQVQSR